MEKVGLRPGISITAIPTCSPAASASASRSRARSCCGRKSWCSTSRCRRSTSRSARRCSICSPSLAGGIPARLCLRLARSLGRASHRRRRAGDLSRPCRRDGLARRDLSRARSTPIRGAAVGDAGRRSRRQARAHPPDGRAALADRAAAGLSVQSALPARLRPLPRREAADRAQAGARRRLLGGRRHERARPTTTSSSAPARRAACSPIASAADPRNTRAA